MLGVSIYPHTREQSVFKGASLLTLLPSFRFPALRQQIRQVRPRPHLQRRRNPLQRHRRLQPQPGGNRHLPRIALPSAPKLRHAPAQTLHFLRQDSPRQGLVTLPALGPRVSSSPPSSVQATPASTSPPLRTNPAGSAHMSRLLSPAAVPPRPPPASAAPPRYPPATDTPPATGPPALWASSNTPANCSTDIGAIARSAAASPPAPDSNAHDHTPSSSIRSRSHPQSTTCTVR